ncbi:hypothetical protein T484DRAFT_1634669, partial [Baffinella frigidus]
LNPKPCTFNPQCSTLNSDPYTLNPQPSTLNPQPSALSPQPSTLNPQPSTLNPQPSTPSHDSTGGSFILVFFTGRSVSSMPLKPSTLNPGGGCRAGVGFAGGHRRPHPGKPKNPKP